DLVVIDRTTGTAVFLAGNGDGTFDAPDPYAVGVKPTSIVATDFDNDGNQDVAVSNSKSDFVSVLFGKGASAVGSQFDAQLRVHYPGGKTAVAIATADFDLDGNPDLAVLNQKKNTFSVLLGTGVGTFSEPVDFSVNSIRKHVPTGIAAADLDG